MEGQALLSGLRPDPLAPLAPLAPLTLLPLLEKQVFREFDELGMQS